MSEEQALSEEAILDFHVNVGCSRTLLFGKDLNFALPAVLTCGLLVRVQKCFLQVSFGNNHHVSFHDV